MIDLPLLLLSFLPGPGIGTGQLLFRKVCYLTQNDTDLLDAQGMVVTTFDECPGKESSTRPVPTNDYGLRDFKAKKAPFQIAVGTVGFSASITADTDVRVSGSVGGVINAAADVRGTSTPTCIWFDTWMDEPAISSDPHRFSSFYCAHRFGDGNPCCQGWT